MDVVGVSFEIGDPVFCREIGEVEIKGVKFACGIGVDTDEEESKLSAWRWNLAFCGTLPCSTADVRDLEIWCFVRDAGVDELVV